MKKHLAILLAVALVLVLLAGCGSTTPAPAAAAPAPAEAAPAPVQAAPAPAEAAPAPVELQRYAFSTSNAGGTWYTMCGGIANLVSEQLGDKYVLDMIASGGSVENCRRLSLGECDVTMTYSSHLLEAKEGVGIMEGYPTDSNRIMFQLYSSSCYFATLANSGIKSLSDLQGKKVVLGPPGSGSSDNSRRILQALGITVQESEMAFGDGARALQDGTVDALGMSGHPSSGLVELANTKDIYIIPFTDEEMNAVIAEQAFFTKGIMKADTYKGQDVDVPCLYFAVYFACSEDVSEEAVYDMCTLFFSDYGREYLKTVHSQFADMEEGAEGAEQIGVPFHPGAVKFWNENR